MKRRGGGKDCDRKRSNRQGYDAVNLSVAGPGSGGYGTGGKYRISWYKSGERVDLDVFLLVVSGD